MIGSFAGVVVLLVFWRIVRALAAGVRARRGPDPALAAIGDGPRYLYTQGRPASGEGAARIASDYDQAKAVKAAARAKRFSASGHRYKRPTKAAAPAPSKVTRIERVG